MEDRVLGHGHEVPPVRIPQRLSVLLVTVLPEDRGHQFVASLADFGKNSTSRHVVAEITEGGEPGLHVSVVGIDQRAVEIEDYGLNC
jgi:hypothetical protein